MADILYKTPCYIYNIDIYFNNFKKNSCIKQKNVLYY